jgi:hypothetical protein
VPFGATSIRRKGLRSGHGVHSPRRQVSPPSWDLKRRSRIGARGCFPPDQVRRLARAGGDLGMMSPVRVGCRRRDRRRTGSAFATIGLVRWHRGPWRSSPRPLGPLVRPGAVEEHEGVERGAVGSTTICGRCRTVSLRGKMARGFSSSAAVSVVRENMASLWTDHGKPLIECTSRLSLGKCCGPRSRRHIGSRTCRR